MHVSVALDKPIELLNITPVNPLISKCQIKVCYVQDEPNRNRSVITKEVAKDLANSIPGCPIVGFYNEADGDFEEHNRVIDISNGKFLIKDTTRPYGFVSMDAPVWFQWFNDDGVEHEYLMTEGYIWTGQYPESKRVVEKGNNQSMELDENSLDATWTKDINGNPEFFIINEAIMSKLCILGENVEPCFEGSQITKVQFSFEDSFKEELFSMIKKMQEILTNEGGTPVFTKYAVEIGDSLWSAIWEYVHKQFPDVQDPWASMYRIEGIFEENDQKFVILQNPKDLKYYRLNFSLTDAEGFVPNNTLIEVTKTYVPAAEPQFALADIEAYAAQYKANMSAKEEEELEPASDEDDDKIEEPAVAEDPVEEPAPVEEFKLNYEAMYTELQGKYAELQAKVDAQAAEIERLTAENVDLTNFKLVVDREKKKELINTFYMLSDEQKKDCFDNIDKYSYDEIEAKLSVICVRNKVSFDLDTPEEKKVTTYNLDEIKDEVNSTPDWVKRVQEVAKENNI